MWRQIIQMIVTSVSSAFGWFNQILNTDSLIWTTVYYVIIAVLAIRFILGPILGFSWVGRSDAVAIRPYGKSTSNGRMTSNRKRSSKGD